MNDGVETQRQTSAKATSLVERSSLFLLVVGVRSSKFIRVTIHDVVKLNDDH